MYKKSAMYLTIGLMITVTVAVSTQATSTNGTFAPTGSMADRRWFHTATPLANGKVLVAGGSNPGSLENTSNTGALDTAELYDPLNGTFTATMGRMTTNRVFHVATLLQNGTVLIAGGYSNSDLQSLQATAEIYDPVSDTFSATGSMTVPRDTPRSTLLIDGRVLIAGGGGPFNGNIWDSAEIYDPATGPATGAFTPTGSMTIPRYTPTATRLLNGKVLFTGGFNGPGALASAEIYDPTTRAFTATMFRMMIDRNTHMAALLADGTVLLAGGDSSGGVQASAEIYDPGNDPVNGTFSQTGNMSVARYGSSVETLAGSVLIIGGSIIGGGNSNGPLASVEIYDPGTGTFTPTGSMTTPRYGHASAMVPNGRVLVTGGWSGNAWLSTAEIFPAPETSLGPAKVWLGLKNSDDVGTKFDLLAEVFKNAELVGSGQLNNVPGGSSGFNNAVASLMNLNLSAPTAFAPGDTLSIRLSVRIAVGVAGHRSGTARPWFNDAAADSHFDATIGGQARSYYNTSGFLLSLSPGAGPKTKIDVFVDRAVGGNPFKPFGRWNHTL